MSILDTTIVNVALETLGRELHSTLADIQWVITGYMLAAAAVIPGTGRAGRRFGPRRLSLLPPVPFRAGSALCGFAGSTTQLIVFGVVQAIGGGMLLPVGQMMMARAAGPTRMGRVMGVVAVPAMLAPILGPTIGGLILDNASWRWIFFVNLPVGVLAFAAALKILPRGEREDAGRLDVRGLALMASGLPLLTYGLAEIGATGSFTATRAVVPFFSGLALIGVFVPHRPIGGLPSGMCVRGMGVGFAFRRGRAAASASPQPRETRDAPPQLTVLRRMGGSIGPAVLAVVLERALAGTTSLDAA